METTFIAWREQLSRRLAQLTAVLTPLVLVPLTLGIVDPRTRAVMASVAVVVFGALLWLSRRRTHLRLRSVGVVAAFLCVGTAGYATIGFLGGPTVAFTAAVAFGGLLGGRKSLFATALIVACLVAATGILMVNHVIPPPLMEDVSPALARPWLRSVGISLLLVVIIGAAVTWVVETIEATQTEANEEARLRREAELLVLQAQSTELIAQLAASLAHDVNNQLTVIASWNSLMAQAHTAADLEEATTAIEQSIGQASALTRQMLVLGRRDTPAPKPVDVSAFLRSNETILRALVPSDIEVTVSAEDGAWCEIDQAQLHQVLLNLAMNARDAMPDGGALTIAVAPRSDATDASNWTALSVTDTGCGMDDRTKQRAFEPFFTTKEVGKGTGLGLATIKVIVERAGGHIALKTSPGRGTSVEIWMPAVAPVALQPAEDASTGQRLDAKRVLLVEDSVAVLSVARSALEQAGAVVVTAADGDEAIANLDGASFEVLCSDVVMPGASVVDVIARFEAKNPEGLVLLCSGYVAEELVRRGVEAGRYQLLAKPYGPADLVRKISVLIASRAAN